MITINKLDVSYGSQNVLKELSITFEEGMVHGIVGYNGAGKTTLLNALFGIPGRSEHILFRQKPLNRKSVSYLMADLFFYPGITGRDYLTIFQKRDHSFDYESLCRIFDVPLDKRTDSYSSGMKRKLAIIAILSLNKEILLLDEPFNGLDLESISILQLVLRKLKAIGRTIIVTSHIIGTLTPVCDTISLLKQGTIQKTYTPDEYERLSVSISKSIESAFDSSINKILLHDISQK